MVLVLDLLFRFCSFFVIGSLLECDRRGGVFFFIVVKMDEVGACLDEEIVDEHTFIDIGNPSPAEEDDYVDILLVKETSFGFRKDKSLVLGNWMKCARLDAIAWILKVSFYFILLLLFWWVFVVFD